jgi:uncharacterized protein (DUF2141 family)
VPPVAMKKFWPSLILLLTTAHLVQAETLTVHATTDGPREGVIAILVFKTKKGFPNQHEQAFRQARFPVTAKDPVECVIPNLPYGEYSLSVLHDVNDNYKADKLLGFGPPKEPVGFSNIHKKLRKQPRFEDALIHFSAETNAVPVSLKCVI